MRCKPWARRETYLPSTRNCRGKYPSDGRSSQKNPNQGRKSQFPKLARYKPASNNTRQVSSFLSLLPLPPPAQSLFTTPPRLQKCQEPWSSRFMGGGGRGEAERRPVSPLPTSRQLNCSGCSCGCMLSGEMFILKQGWHVYYYTKLRILSTELKPQCSLPSLTSVSRTDHSVSLSASAQPRNTEFR